MPQSKVLGALVGVLCLSALAAASLPTVDLGYTVQQATLNETGSYYNFSNIRYAQPPVGSLRFSAPLAPTGTNKTVNDGQQSVVCPAANPAWENTVESFLLTYLTGGNISNFTTQTSVSPYAHLNVSALPESKPPTSEDCLFLDVMVPTSIFNSTKGAPVLVWIYGGGYTGGNKAGSGNPAGLIARSLAKGSEGVIFVAMNYRLGLFGWLSGNDNVTANAGLLDQRLALDWVQNNIHLFGGDKSRVTIMGESAGAGSIMHHITAYGGNGTVPFQQAIPQSPAFQPFVPSQSEALFKQVLANASTLANKTIASAEDLRALPYQILYDLNAVVVGSAMYGSFSFGPVVDSSPGAYVPDFPARLITQGKFHNVSVTVGHNSDEGVLFTPPTIQTNTELVDALQNLFPTANTSTVNYITNTLYPAVYNGTYGYTDAIGRTALAISDFLVACNANALASTLSTAYAYYFAIIPGLHGEDIPYTFFNGDTSTIDDALPVNATIAMAFQRYLVDFVMNGRPTSEGYPAFVQYGSNGTVANIALSGLGSQSKDPGAKPVCAFWNAAPYYVAEVNGTNSTPSSTGGSSASPTRSGPAATTSKSAGGVMRPEMSGVMGLMGLVAWLIL